MHSVGGMEVIARLQSNLNLFGSFIPPHCCIAHSFVNQEARKSSNSDDIWDLKYIPTIAHNFKEAINRTHNYKSWVVDQIEKEDVWIKINE